ncbi:MAG: NAD(P)-binding domain-containing protein, partial [Hyphomicrobiaceae bacterium]|nr:NAD(P)-binding domain-containing protein [Hyphomicrobiaceae bacterium]
MTGRGGPTQAPAGAEADHTVFGMVWFILGAPMTRLALIGFGEVGQTFARGLAGKEGVQVAAYDLLFDDDEKQGGMIARAEALGVRVAADAADAAREAHVV